MKSLIIALAFFLSLVSTSTFAAKSTIYDGFLSDNKQGELSTFVGLMHQVFSQETLQRIFDGEERFTLFAPTNAAFEALFAELNEEALAELQDVDSGVLEELLRFHITRGKWRKPTGALQMLDGDVAHTYSEGRDLKIQQATILKRARFKNGIVATIDVVMSSQAVGAKINFLNCSPEKVTFWVFNGGDFLCVVPRHIVNVDPDGGKKTRKCNDKRNGCKIIPGSEASVGSCDPALFAKDGQTVVTRRFLGPNVFSGQVLCESEP